MPPHSWPQSRLDLRYAGDEEGARRPGGIPVLALTYHNMLFIMRVAALTTAATNERKGFLAHARRDRDRSLSGDALLDNGGILITITSSGPS